MLLDNFLLRACYADTDSAGVIHHARYLEYFERSRTEWLARLGMGPDELEGRRGQALVVREVHMAFRQPGRFNDLVCFTHTITRRGRSQMTLVQEAWRVPPANPVPQLQPEALLASATFQLVCVDLATMRSTPLPDVFQVSDHPSAAAHTS